MINYLKLPNLPESEVKLVLVDGRINNEIKNSLKNKGIRIIKTIEHPNLYAAVAFHPDMMLHHIGDKDILFAPNTPEVVLKELEKLGFNLLQGSTLLKSTYPFCIPYNVARVGNIAFHNMKYTDKILSEMLYKQGVKIIHVNQGYAKCSTMVVGEKTIITSDTGIHNCAIENRIESLLLPPQKNIELPGLDYGFIGGCTVLIDSKTVAFTGCISRLDSFQLINKFLAEHNIAILELSQNNVIDVGSIIPLLCR